MGGRNSLDLFGGVAPLLRQVSVDAIAIPWNSPILSQLTTLDLANTKVTNNTIRGPSMKELFDILRLSSGGIRQAYLASILSFLTPEGKPL